ncbi:hypothetical protein [Nonomuraea typhae]|uniref:hypothetical protein n=1 Tax=Nonomuraea typhae TaxID=2603600 RepID=UPI0012F7E42F|nr:hypothetical protein [Nonomuraea typhae]
MEQDYERRLVLAFQAHGFDARTARMQQLTSEGLRGTLSLAAGRARLDPGSWDPLSVAGGELVVVLPLSTPETVVCDRFVHELHAATREHNRLTTADGRLRLRLAIHFGMSAGCAAHGFTGPGPVMARDLANCAAARALLDRTSAALVVIMSSAVVEDTIAGQLTSLEQQDLHEVDAGSRRRAWLWVPGGAADVPEPPAEPASDTALPSQGPFAHATITAGFVAGRDITVEHRGANP